MSRRMRSALASMARACSSKVSPAGVGATPCRRLLDRAAAHGLPVTLHRAIDTVRDPVTAADAAIALGVDRVLSSGGAPTAIEGIETLQAMRARAGGAITVLAGSGRSEEHTSELQSLMRISYAVFCLKKKTSK